MSESFSVASFIGQTRPMLINGEWVMSSGGEAFPVFNPATGEEIARVTDAAVADVDTAVAAARQAFEGKSWRRMPPAERCRLLWSLADLLEANADALVEMEVMNQGKVMELARHLDVEGSADTLRYYAGWTTKIEGTTLDISFPDFRGDGAQGPAYHAYSLRQPIGVVAAIVPWNVPLVMAIAKLAPALAAGCTVVLRPAQETPLTTLRLGELIMEAGFPPGVVNILTANGPEVPAAMAAHMDVDKVAFTGSTQVGKLIAEAAAKTNLKKVGLELGGNRPVIICEDADIDKAAQGVIDGMFVNAGQMCFAGSRLLVDERIFDQVMGRVSELAAAIKVGPGNDPSSDMGPLISAVQKQRVCDYIESGIKDGAEILTGGKALDRPGYFVEPTVMVCRDPSISVMCEEVFGPVLTATPIKNASDIVEVTKEANNTPYGLTASIWTNDLSRAHALAAEINAGTVWINCAFAFDEGLPFAGHKQSGWGHEGSRLGVEEYLEPKSVVVALS
ncbi:aldehyde dehydrogenase family protein [Pseudomaricurvus alkylphenolicus]|uniref:aldehyde dehydrogenase family protein n=1 Tax=Pseudomaricurvus alkylphenolicus TaxID=1306991 RepID=UPI001423B0C9|nr:aldehyde dehydrogenase family protein [Pseudomaricurvus alkylphenolicus]NIB38912.1 aldehyde dehydrogenase family protein [Pseudomaricurvus alkylphenolicus]